MKNKIFLFPILAGFILLASCNDQSSQPVATKNTESSPVTDNWKLGVQMWTFRMFSQTEALKKADSGGVKFIEAYLGQPFDNNSKDTFGLNLSDSGRQKLKALLQSHQIQMVAMGVTVPKTREEWIKTFDLAKYFGLSYITSEPIKTHWDLIDSLAGAYAIRVAIHDHPKPNPYWHPDSVLAAIAGRKNIGACADIGHWARSGLNIVECLKKLEGHIYGVHLKDIREFDKADAADTTVGKGIIDFTAALSELKRQNFSGMLSIEHESNWLNNVPDVIETVRFYNEELEKLKK
ncbi:MAG: sugar phosphate isomerase/epimerase [Ferruginibacter sp.]